VEHCSLVSNGKPSRSTSSCSISSLIHIIVVLVAIAVLVALLHGALHALDSLTHDERCFKTKVDLPQKVSGCDRVRQYFGKETLDTSQVPSYSNTTSQKLRTPF
jgi:hypothetical protein